METPFVLGAGDGGDAFLLVLPAGEELETIDAAPEPVVKRAGTVELKKPVFYAVIGGVRLQRDIAAIAVAGKAAGVDVEDGD